jgi:hypothetical protein
LPAKGREKCLQIGNIFLKGRIESSPPEPSNFEKTQSSLRDAGKYRIATPALKRRAIFKLSLRDSKGLIARWDAAVYQSFQNQSA